MRTPRVMAVTMSWHEAAMLPRWIAYYGGQLGLDNLLVVDDNSVDGSTRQLPCTTIHLPPAPWRDAWGAARIKLANRFAGAMLCFFDVVIFTDVDEFLVRDPARHDGLLAYLAARADQDVIAPVGVNLLHHEAVEPPLDPARPVLSQRRLVNFTPDLCTPVVKRIPAN
jgi:hypothetical protein